MKTFQVLFLAQKLSKLRDIVMTTYKLHPF